MNQLENKRLQSKYSLIQEAKKTAYTEHRLSEAEALYTAHNGPPWLVNQECDHDRKIFTCIN